MKEIILALIGCVFVNNVVLAGGYGVTATMSVGKKNKCILLLSAATCCVTLLSSVVLFFLKGVLDNLGLTYFCVIALAVLFSFIIHLVASKKEGYNNSYFALVALNSAVFGIVLNAIAQETVLLAVLSPIASSVGFMVTMFIYSTIRYNINDKFVPKAFKGLPIDLMIAAIMALAFAALAL